VVARSANPDNVERQFRHRAQTKPFPPTLTTMKRAGLHQGSLERVRRIDLLVNNAGVGPGISVELRTRSTAFLSLF